MNDFVAESMTLTLTFSPQQWQAWLDAIVEVDASGDRPKGLRLRRTLAPETKPRDMTDVDEYVLSAYAEALQSSEVDGELWTTYEDLELTGAEDDAAAWAEIVAFYQNRGCTLVTVEGTEQDDQSDEQWIFAPEIVQQLELDQWPNQ